MSVIAEIKVQIQKKQYGEPFTNSQFLNLGSRTAVDKSMSRLVKEFFIIRITRGVFVRPKKSRFVGNVMPEISTIIEVIAKDHNEIIQVHGADAVRQFKISTQMPTTPVYYTSGLSREIHIGKLTVKLIHASSRKLQYAGTKLGLALTALWYLGKEQVNDENIHFISNNLSPQEFKTLCSSSIPTWMAQALSNYNKQVA